MQSNIPTSITSTEPSSTRIQGKLIWYFMVSTVCFLTMIALFTYFLICLLIFPPIKPQKIENNHIKLFCLQHFQLKAFKITNTLSIFYFLVIINSRVFVSLFRRKSETDESERLGAIINFHCQNVKCFEMILR